MSRPERASGVDWSLLGLYISDHLTGATAGVQRLQRMAGAFEGSPFGAQLDRIAQELVDERTFLKETLKKHGLPRRKHRQDLARLMERVARLKTNGRLISPSPMTPVLESELMRAAIVGKIGGWQTIGANREALEVSQETVDGLIAQARRQIDDLSDMHQWARERAFIENDPGRKETS